MKFGKPISLKAAETMYVSAIDIKNRSQEAIDNAIKADRPAKRFFLGKEIAYIFDRDALQLLWDVVNMPTASKRGIIFYIGAKFDETAITEGRPTIMAFVYDTFTDIAGNETINLITKDGRKIEKSDDPATRFFVRSGSTVAYVGDNEDGSEHPGGGSADDDNFTKLASAGLPVFFDAAHIHKWDVIL